MPRSDGIAGDTSAHKHPYRRQKKVCRQRPRRANQTIAHYLHNKGQIAVVSLVAPYRAIREELKAVAPVHEVYVHTTELRGREDKAAADYEAPTERFIDIDTTNRQVDECLSELLARVEIQTTS